METVYSLLGFTAPKGGVIAKWMPRTTIHKKTERIKPMFQSPAKSIKQTPNSAIVLCLFFLSGVTSLIYEVLWQKALHQVLGDTTIATAVILASFMGGLALGSVYFGRLADKIKSHLQMYAFLEIGIGLFAIFFPYCVGLIKSLYVVLFQHFQHYPALFNLSKFVISCLVLLLPTFLMGGTLPLIIKFLTKNFRNFGWSSGKIYGINTLGGAIGCFSAGFFLVAAIGINATTYLAVAMNFVIAGIVFIFLILGRTPQAVKEIAENKPALKDKQPPCADLPNYPDHVSVFILWAYALSGFCALAYEVFWTRSLVFFLNNDTYSFTIMLSTILFSLALGSLIFSKFIDKRNLLNWFGIVEILIGCFVVLAIFEFSIINKVTFDFALAFLCKGEINWRTVNIAKIVISFLILFFPSLLMGITFPMVATLYSRNMNALGQRIGIMYSANTLGSVLGPIAAAFVFIPLVGIVWGLFLTAIINIVLGFVVLLINPFTNNKIKIVFTTGFFIVLAALFLAAPFNQKITLFSPLYADLRTGGKVLYYKEGTSATVTVHALPVNSFEVKSKKTLVIEVDGTNVAGTDPMLRATQKIQGHIPLLLYKARCGRDPEYVFSLGLGTGDASYSATCHNIKRIDCLELVDAERGANKYFSNINHNLLNNPKFNLIINDARNHLLGTTQKYDVIASDAVHPEVNINTFTKEYFELAKARLTENGFCTAWLPLFNLSEYNQMVLFKTFQSVFPYVSIWYLPDFMNIHALLVGSKKKLSIDLALLKKEFELPLVKQSLSEANVENVFEILNCFVTDETGLKKDYEKCPLNTDDNLFLAFTIPKQRERGIATVAPNLQLFNSRGKDIFPFIINRGDSAPDLRDFFAVQFEKRKCILEAIALDFNSRFAEEIKILQKAYAMDSNDKYVKSMLKQAYVKLGLTTISNKGPREAFTEFSRALDLDPNYPEALCYQGRALLQMDRLDEARQKLELALKNEPKGARILDVMGMLSLKKGEFARAKELFEKAIELDPYLVTDAYVSLAYIYKGEGRNADAIELLKKGIVAAPNNVEVRLLLSNIYAANGDKKEAKKELEDVLQINPRHLQAREALDGLKKR
jgi:spermidine synthase